ncbi:Uncharacterized protein GBIM_06010 [Gryllus bimaculatus]|nr:Uncharacterized protein GBIM_06010 [Gryllus bimaculatus]
MAGFDCGPSLTCAICRVLQESLCDKERVTLAQLTFNSSGAYRCEVSVEAPSFDTAHQSANMSVMDWIVMELAYKRRVCAEVSGA